MKLSAQQERRALFRIAAPGFVAPVEFDNLGHVTMTAPRLWFMFDWDFERVRLYCRDQRWQFGLVPLASL
jgi:hypothetical protein